MDGVLVCKEAMHAAGKRLLYGDCLRRHQHDQLLRLLIKLS